MFRIKPVFIIVLLLLNLQSWSQKWIKIEKDHESVKFKSSQVLVTRDTILFSVTDSFAVLKKGDKYKIRTNPYYRSEIFYDSLQIKSYKNKITRELYHLLIRSAPIEVQDTSNFDQGELVFLKYQGLKIRNIRLKKVDVIEGSIHDTSIVAQSLIGEWAHHTHINSRDFVILNNLTIREGDRIDAIKLSDNERILRNSSYIEDARILVVRIPPNPDLADIIILTKDKYSLGIGFDYKGLENFSTYLYDKNFFGTGQEMRHYLIYRAGYEPQCGYAFRYKVNNIFNTFTTARLDYEHSWDRELIGINIKKDFLTQQTKYAGGINLYEIADTREYAQNDSVIVVPYRTFNQDYWIGRAFRLYKFKETTVGASFRFANANFKRRPFVSQDSNYFYHDRNLVLAGLSLTYLKYYKSSLVYGFGVTEDIPYGYKFSLLLGHEKDQFINRPYFGVGFSYGKHYKSIGYLLLDAEYGSFYTKSEVQDMVLKFKLLNIGNIYHLNRYSIRNFIDLDFQSGINMSDTESKAIINGRWTSIVSGLKKEGLKGEQKLTAGFESILFTPWYLLGFKFAILGNINLGWVSQESLFKNTSFYGNIGFGVRIKNESWVFETITLGFAYFLRAPVGSDRMGLIFDGSDPRLFRNLNPGKPDIIRMDQEPALFLD